MRKRLGDWRKSKRKFGDTIETRLAKARFLIHQKGKEGLPQLADFTKDVDKLPAADQEPEQLAQLHWQLAQLCWSQQDASLGRQYGRQAAELSPNNLQFRLSLLRNALDGPGRRRCQTTNRRDSIDRQGGAVTLYSQAVYDFTRYLADKANGKDGAATLSEARDKLLQAQRLRPTWVQVPLLLGDIAREQKDDDAALGYYQRAMELGNRDAETYAQVAFILYRRGRFDDADDGGQEIRTTAEHDHAGDGPTRQPYLVFPERSRAGSRHGQDLGGANQDAPTK